MPLFNEKENEVRNDILERLQVDPGRLTFGGLQNFEHLQIYDL